MANYSTLKAAVNQYIKENGNKEITGPVLNGVLNTIISSIGLNYQLAGIANPATNPGTPDQNVFYLATEKGQYVNFRGLTLNHLGLAVFLWNGSWQVVDLLNLDDYYAEIDADIEDFKDELRLMLEEYQPIVIEGNVTNAPDEQDLTSEDDLLRFKSRGTLYGMGYIYLRNAPVEGVNILTQEMLSQQDTIYVIRYDYDLNGEEITIPDGCVLDFQGGSLSNGTVVFSDTMINAEATAFTNCSFGGTLAYGQVLDISIFGIVGNGNTDVSAELNQILSAVDQRGCELLFASSSDYIIGSSTNHTKVQCVSDVTLTFIGKGFLKLGSYSDGGQLLLIDGCSNVTLNNIKIDGGGTEAIGGASGQNGIAINDSHNITINGAIIKNCKRGDTSEVTASFGGKAIQIESTNVNGCFITDVTINDCFRALSVQKNLANKGGIKVEFNNIKAFDCEQFMCVSQSNLDDFSGKEETVILNNFIAENCGNFEGMFVFSRARNVTICNGVIISDKYTISGNNAIDAIFLGSMANCNISNVSITQEFTALIDLRARTYNSDMSDNKYNSLDVRVLGNYSYLFRRGTSQENTCSQLYNTYKIYSSTLPTTSVFVGGSFTNKGPVTFFLLTFAQKQYNGHQSAFIVDYSGIPSNLPDNPVFYNGKRRGDSSSRPTNPQQGLTYYDTTKRKLLIAQNVGYLDAEGGADTPLYSPSANLPSLAVGNEGTKVYITNEHRWVSWNGYRWVDFATGCYRGLACPGNGDRPNQFVKQGYCIFDIYLGKPIWAKTVVDGANYNDPQTITWVDATGATV